MSKLSDQKKPLLKSRRNKTRSSIEDRWREDAKWFKEDAKKHPEKYKAKNEEKRVSSEELEGYLKSFIKEEDATYKSNHGEVQVKHTTVMNTLAKRRTRFRKSTKNYSKKKQK